MQTLSSASRTCIASASAVECTATVAMPSSLHARRTRRAISPRLAIRILSNILPCEQQDAERTANSQWRSVDSTHYSPLPVAISLNDNQRFAEFDRLAVLDENLRHRARPRRRDLVHRLHGFNDEQRIADLHL